MKDKKIVTRASAVRQIAESVDPVELRGFLGHKNKHVVRAALHKLIRLHTSIRTGELTQTNLLKVHLNHWPGLKNTDPGGRVGEICQLLALHKELDAAHLLYPAHEMVAE
jgi:hypothetical protein